MAAVTATEVGATSGHATGGACVTALPVRLTTVRGRGRIVENSRLSPPTSA
jgi:hypothetical protein